jgi:hypothetical protein
MLASIYNVPQTPGDLLIWSFNNADLHNQIRDRIRTKFGTTLTDYQLDPIPVQDMASWAYRHQLFHNAQNAVLGIAGNDLTNFNPQDVETFRGWIELHALEMQLACTQLGVG